MILQRKKINKLAKLKVNELKKKVKSENGKSRILLERRRKSCQLINILLPLGIA